MHAEIDRLTPVLEKINSGATFTSDDSKVIEGVTENTIKDIFDWIEQEKKRSPASDLTSPQGLYTRFVDAYSMAREKNEKLKGTYTEAIKHQMSWLKSQVVATTAPQWVTVLTISQEKLSIPENVDSKSLIQLKNQLENEANWPINVESLTMILSNLKEEKDPDNRAIITSYVWSKLTNNGYILSIQQWKIMILNPDDDHGATLLQNTLQAHLKANVLNLSDLQRAMIVGPSSFWKYLDTQRIDIKNASTEGYIKTLLEMYSIHLENVRTVQDKIRIIVRSKASREEQALIISFFNNWLTGYNVAPEIERQDKISKISKKIQSSPAFQNTQNIIDKASGGSVKNEQQVMSKTWENLTVESFMNNPTRAISKYPWTSLALIAGSIWQFGFGKTIFWLLAWVIGIKAIHEIGWETGLGKMMKDTKQEIIDGSKGKKKPDESEPDKSDTETHAESSEGEKKETAGQKYIGDKIRGSEFKKLFDSEKWKQKNKNAPLEQYLDFINFDIADKPVSIFFAPDTSVFDNDKPIDSSVTLPSHFEIPIFKSLMRMYLTGEYMPIAGRTPEKIEANKKAIEEAKTKIGNNTSTILKEAVAKLYISK
jgi:hypothetical protein